MHVTIIFLVFSQYFPFSKQETIPAGHLQPLGSHRPPEGQINSIQHLLNPTEFYNDYVLKVTPVILKGAARLSPAYDHWTDNYLREKYGEVNVRVDYAKKENRAKSADVMTLTEFLNTYNDSDQYLVDSLPEEMWGEFILPPCLLCGGFTSRLQDASLWFSSGGSKSFLHMDTVDNINCLMSGVKEWFIVDLEHSKRIDMDHGEGDYCGANVDKIDMLKYPSLQSLPWWSARLESGDCLYLPYGWAHQVTSHLRNLAVNIWWSPLQSFNTTDCEVHTEKGSNLSEAKMSNFKFTHGEHHRFMALQVIREHGGSVSFGLVNSLIVGEHTGERLITRERFQMLDKDKDGHLTEDDVISLPADVIETAFGHVPPGEINLRGEHMRLDPQVVSLLEVVDTQPPFVEEFLLRHDKTFEDYQSFLEQHSDNLDQTVKKFIQDKLDQEVKGETSRQHSEL